MNKKFLLPFYFDLPKGADSAVRPILDELCVMVGTVNSLQSEADGHINLLFKKSRERIDLAQLSNTVLIDSLDTATDGIGFEIKYNDEVIFRVVQFEQMGKKPGAWLLSI